MYCGKVPALCRGWVGSEKKMAAAECEINLCVPPTKSTETCKSILRALQRKVPKMPECPACAVREKALHRPKVSLEVVAALETAPTLYGWWATVRTMYAGVR